MSGRNPSRLRLLRAAPLPDTRSSSSDAPHVVPNAVCPTPSPPSLERGVAGILAVARDSGENPAELLLEVQQFRSALDADLSLAATHNVGAAATGRQPPTAGWRIPVRQRGIAAAAAGLVVLAGVGTAVAAVAASHHGTGGGKKDTHVQALELSAAQQYGVLALAAHQRLPGAIVSAAVALHQSLTPLLAEASSNGRTAHTVLQLLQNEQSVLLASGAATTGPLSGILAQNRVLIAQVKGYAADTPVGPAISPVALPSSAAPSLTSTPTPTPTVSAPATSPSPSSDPPSSPTPTPTATTPPASPTPTPSSSISTDSAGRVSSAIGASDSQLAPEISPAPTGP